MLISRTFSSIRFSIGILGISLLITALLYGKTLSYKFVYDDDWRIVKNPAVQNLKNILPYIIDPRTQAAFPELQKHTYRPLPTLAHAMGHSVWGMNPGLFRLQNLILHSLNGFLIASLGIALLNLSPLGAALACIFFIVHPIQTESVVWISELSNLLAVTWILLGIASWLRHRRKEGACYLPMTYLFLFLGFITREISVCLGPAIILIDVILFNKKDRIHHSILVALTIAYVFWRGLTLGQFSQSPLWGGGLITNFLNVIQVLPFYFQSVFFPHALRIVYFDIPIARSLNPGATKGLLVAAFYIAFVVWARRRSKALLCTALLLVLFWLPGSNIVPLNTLFAERLLYPMMAALAWVFAWVIDSRPWRTRNKIIVSILVLVILGWRTAVQLPVWREEDSLWRNAVGYEPQYYFAWACLANAQIKKIDLLPPDQIQQRRNFLNEAEKLFRKALDCRPQPFQAGEILVCLAIVNFQQGKSDIAQKNAREGLRLRPDLKDKWSPYAKATGDTLRLN